MSENLLPPVRRARVRCNRVDVQDSRNSRCRVEVEVQWLGGPAYVGIGQGNATPQGHALAGAEAALQAVVQAASAALELEIRGTRLVRAFDSLLVIVAVRARILEQRVDHAGARIQEQRVDLIGATVAPGDDVTRGAVLAFLDATNRLLERDANPANDSPA